MPSRRRLSQTLPGGGRLPSRDSAPRAIPRRVQRSADLELDIAVGVEIGDLVEIENPDLDHLHVTVDATINRVFVDIRAAHSSTR